jgi:hypothetical protein
MCIGHSILYWSAFVAYKLFICCSTSIILLLLVFLSTFSTQTSCVVEVLYLYDLDDLSSFTRVKDEDPFFKSVCFSHEYT